MASSGCCGPARSSGPRRFPSSSTAAGPPGQSHPAVPPPSPLIPNGCRRARLSPTLGVLPSCRAWQVVKTFGRGERESVDKPAAEAGTGTRASAEKRLAAPPLAGLPLDHLDPDQRAAAVADTPLLIVAGPGTGKTRTLTHRIANLAHRGVPAEQILAITFTRRAAQELRDRLSVLVPAAAGQLCVTTFHGLGLRILREQHDRAGLPERFGVADEATRLAVATELAGSQRAGKALLADVSNGLAAERDGFRKALLSRGLVDFDGLVEPACRLLRDEPALAQGYRRRWPEISVDEYQDIDAAQYGLLALLARAEAGWIAAIIDDLLGGSSFHSLDSGRADGHGHGRLGLADIAVLHRTGAQSGPLLQALTRAGLRCQKHTHDRLADRPGVALLMRQAQLAVTPAAAVMDNVETRLHAALQAVTNLLPATGSAATDARAAAEVLLPLARRCGDDLGQFHTEVSLGAEVDAADPRAEAIALLTLHAAKGLEFEVVFVAGCEDGVLPLWLPGAAPLPDNAEERRLLFVGMTRARSRLFLTYARHRTRWGAQRATGPSPFLTAISRDLIARTAEPPRRRPAGRQLRLL